MLQVDIQLSGLLSALISTSFGLLFWAIKWLLERNTHVSEKRLAHIEALVTASADKGLALEREIKDEVQHLWREFMQFQTDAANNYVRREDHIRAYSVIESRLEMLGERMQRVIEKLGERYDGRS